MVEFGGAYYAPGAPGAAFADVWGDVDTEPAFASIEAGETAPISQPFNPPALGIAPFISNSLSSVSEIMRQQIPAIPLPPKPGSKEYVEFLSRQQLKEYYNEEKVGIAPLPNNQKSTAAEINKQTQGPNLWERFTTAVAEGYSKEPEDVNTFTKSIDQLGAATLGIVKPSTYTLLAVAGVALLLVLLVK